MFVCLCVSDYVSASVCKREWERERERERDEKRKKESVRTEVVCLNRENALELEEIKRQSIISYRR